MTVVAWFERLAEKSGQAKQLHPTQELFKQCRLHRY